MSRVPTKSLTSKLGPSTLTILSFISCVVSATVINVPSDQPTIQAGVDAAADGDTVLVQPGTYIENILVYRKDVTLASRFLVTQDPTYIDQTVIDGNDNGSAIFFSGSLSETPTLTGFTLINGSGSTEPSQYRAGGGIRSSYCDPIVEHVVVCSCTADFGGGVFCGDASYMILRDVIVEGNEAVYEAGGIHCGYYSRINMGGTVVRANRAFRGGGLVCTGFSNIDFDTDDLCSVYLNRALFGNDLYWSTYSEEISVIVDTFTVLNPSNFYAYPLGVFTFDIENAAVTPIEADLFVSPSGDDSNSGLTFEDPFRTADHALYVIAEDSLHPRTIHLAPGVYSPEANGERFPLPLRSHVSLSGGMINEVVLDAAGEAPVLWASHVRDFRVENLTVKGGSNHPSIPLIHGGGLLCQASDGLIEGVSIIENSVEDHAGGGAYVESSSVVFRNVLMADNHAEAAGGGIYLLGSNPRLENVLVCDNAANGNGGGLFCFNSSPVLVNVTLAGNSAGETGDGIHFRSDSHLDLVNTIVWGNAQDDISSLDYGLPNSITISYCDIGGGQAGVEGDANCSVYWLDGNIEDDPLFADGGNGDYRLTWANFPVADSTRSPCIDAGIPDTTGLVLPDYDIDGNPRIIGGRIDMGVYEYVTPYSDSEIASTVPGRLRLCQNYPNPFTRSTVVHFTAPAWWNPEGMTISVYDSRGSLVKTLSSPTQTGDTWKIIWDGTDDQHNQVCSGDYFYRLDQRGQTIAIKRCILLK